MLAPELISQLRQWRHHLHRHPELPFEEHATATFVADTLASLGMEPTTGVGGTGVVASLTRGSGHGVIALRADMDCLPISETGRHDHVSTRPGASHACGHDGHTTMLLGAAAYLAEHGGFDGTVRFIFQPAEETGRGAQAMVDDGLFLRFPVEAVYGLHNMPGLPVGSMKMRRGEFLAREDNFEIRIKGQGGHSSQPNVVIDPLVVGAEILLALQTVVSRSIDPSECAVLSCTQFSCDGSRNAIPSQAIIRGDTRSFSLAVSQRLEGRIREIASGVSDAYGATCNVLYSHEFETTVNDARCVEVAASAARKVLGKDNVDDNCDVMLGSEDFGVLAREVPGCFAFIGNGVDPDAGGQPLHSSEYDFNDEVLDLGVRYFAALVRTVLIPTDSSSARHTTLEDS